MRWSRLLLLGLASVYPLYWTAQFLLFFVPETLVAFWLGQPIRVISVSYLQAMAVVYPRAAFAAHWEALVFALIIAAAIVGMDADRFLTGALAVVALGQAALLPCLSLTLSGPISFTTICAGLLAFALIVFGLYRTLQRIGGQVFLDRLAFLSLLTVLPQAMLWLVFKFAYPFFDVRFLLLRIIPLYLAAIVASAIPANISEPVFNGVRWIEIIASSAAASLLIIAITLGDHSFNAKELQQNSGPSPTSQIARPDLPPLAIVLPYLPMQC
jgi:hypothetical protein